jgi:hypothetical protein
VGWARRHPKSSIAVAAVVLLLVIAGVAGKKPSSTSSTATTTVTVAQKPAPQKHRNHGHHRRVVAAQPTSMRHCNATIQAGALTSCLFAKNVFTDVANSEGQNGSLPASVTAYSPVTHQTYSLTCGNAGGAVVCTNATGSRVIFPLRAAVSAGPSNPPSQTSPAPAQPVEGPGSSSHATDAAFCSTHTCIPNFPNGNGTVVQCVDGEWSHSGGLSGACSDHGGES